VVDIERRRATQRDYYARNRERVLALKKAIRDAKPREPKVPKATVPFGVGTPEYNREVKRRWRERDPERALRQSREQRARRNARHPEENAAMQVIYRQCGLRWRASERAAWVEPVVPLVVYELADGICWICGEDVPPSRYEIDHVIPLAASGEHSYENVRLAHTACNRRTSRQGRAA
jgi:5-methylcytosine-specific restriction endonuclease McrA